MAVDQNIGLPPDSTGKKVRVLEITALDSDGSVQTVEMQVIAIADRRGQLLGLSSTEGLLQGILDKLEEIRFELSLRGG
jgi:hypothetical protein